MQFVGFIKAKGYHQLTTSCDFVWTILLLDGVN